MPFSAYNSDAIRLLSAALSEALEIIRQSQGSRPAEGDAAKLSKRMADNLMIVFDRGERDPLALRRAALDAISASPRAP